jgi:glycosyltransferase involved in cell wall biosynthesis
VKILALSNLYPPDVQGGYELGCAQMVDGLRARGHEVLVTTAAPRQAVPSAPHVRRVLRLIDEWNKDAMGLTRLIEEWHRNSIGQSRLVVTANSAVSRLISAHNVYVLTQELDRFQPDVVLLNNLLGLGGLGLVACLQFLGVPWVWHLGDCIPNILCRGFGGFDPPIPGLAAEFSKRFQGTYIVVTQQLRDEMESRGVLLRGHVAVIPYWINGARPPARTRVGAGRALRIMSAGQVTREKGIDLLIQAVGLVRDAGFPQVSLDIYGAVDDPYFESLISKLKLAGQVRLYGSRPQRELLELYGCYDVFAFPTREREPFGLVPLEAAARGCVPIITRRCGVAEWLVHGVHCLKAERTAASFAEILRRIVEGRIDLEPIARRAEAAAWRDFHLDTILPRIERTLAGAAGRPRAAAGTAADAYRMARMAEQLTEVLIQEDAQCA